MRMHCGCVADAPVGRLLGVFVAVFAMAMMLSCQRREAMTVLSAARGYDAVLSAALTMVAPRSRAKRMNWVSRPYTIS